MPPSLYFREIIPVPIELEALWAPQLVWVRGDIEDKKILQVVDTQQYRRIKIIFT
jgi:hypothetical protein